MKVPASFLLAAGVATLFSELGRATTPQEIYVCYGNNNTGKVGAFDAAGAPINADLISGFGNPTGIVISGSVLYVVDNLKGTVSTYDAATGAALNAPLIGGLFSPTGVAVSGSSLFVTTNLAAGDSTGEVSEYTIAGALIDAAFVTGLSSPSGLYLAGDFLYVADTGNNRVGKYSLDGTVIFPTFLSQIPSYGVLVTDENIFVSTDTAPRLIKYSLDGLTRLDSWTLQSPGRVGSNLLGDNLLVANQDGDTVKEYDTDGNLVNAALISNVPTPNAIAVSPLATTPARLQNISSRLDVQTGDNVLIAGFIITGTSPQQILLRGLGPSLSEIGITGVLPNPTLTLNYPGGATVSNDDWQDTQEAAIAATGLAPTNPFESALLETLPPGAYTAEVSGRYGGSGVGLVELYDVDADTSAQMANISTRGKVLTGDDVLIGGFIIGGDEVANIIVRALGPSLAKSGISGFLPNPCLELHNSDGTSIASNDDWQASAQKTQIQADDLAPTDPLEAALFATLGPGAYTAIVRDSAGATGVGLVEIYHVP